MRKLLLTFTAMLFCSIASFAQITPVQPNEGSGTVGDPYKIDRLEEFMWINSDNDAHYELTDNIDLGTYASNNNFVIESFSGTFDGGNYTITYNGNFTVSDNAKIGLFKSVSGIIRNLDVDATISVSGDDASSVKIGLLCGKSTGTIEFCDITGSINSSVKPGLSGHSSTGLIMGSNFGTLQYCTGHGNVIGAGYVGGLVGDMGNLTESIPNGTNPLIRACYFTGNVTAENSATGYAEAIESIVDWFGGEIGLESFAGGICGTIRNPAKIELCVAEAIVVVGQNAGGITTTTLGTSGFIVNYRGNSGSITNSYCTGTINGSNVNENNVVNKLFNNTTCTDNDNPNYAGNEYLNEIVGLLEEKRGDDSYFYFTIINGKIVLIIGQPCQEPINLIVAKEGNDYIASWSVANPSLSASFVCKLDGTTLNSTPTYQNNVYKLNLGTLSSRNDVYKFSVESSCAAEDETYSDELTYSFYVNNCNAITSLQASNITTTTATINWEGTASSVKLNDNTITLNNGETLTGLTPATTYTISVYYQCTQEGTTTNLPVSITFTTKKLIYETAKTGNFGEEATWVGGTIPQGSEAQIIINQGHTLIVNNHNLVITNDYKIIDNNGVLKITQGGQLINTTNGNVLGIVEIETAIKATETWTFIGAPFKDYELGCIMPNERDVSVKEYDYSEADWSDSWADIYTDMEAGEGYFAFPFLGAPITFTTHGDVGTYQDWLDNGYANNNTVTELNNSNVVAPKEETTITADENGARWMALSNPYPAKLSVDKFVDENNIANYSTAQGKCIYRLKVTKTKNEDDEIITNYSFEPIFSGDIAMTEGFFVNLASGSSSVTFSKTQLTNYPTTQAKSQVAPREFIELSLVKGNHKSKLYIAHNEEAEQNYDIFDANKLFALGEIAEPYFVTDGIALVKEEFAELPYYATMNVRSFADDTVSFVVNNIPEGYSVSIIDGENIIDMVEGGVYTTEILTGENADRFKVLIKKSVSISDVEELEVNITNNNRHISIETTETDLQVEVYNALGQKVLSTKDRNFTLNQVSAGAYLIKAFNNKASKTQKIVVE